MLRNSTKTFASFFKNAFYSTCFILTVILLKNIITSNEASLQNYNETHYLQVFFCIGKISHVSQHKPLLPLIKDPVYLKAKSSVAYAGRY